MNERERMLAIVLGVIAAGLVGWWGVASVGGMFTQRENDLTKFQREVNKKKLDLVMAQRAAKKLAEFEARSLPPDAELAKSLYQTWLLSTIEKSGWSDVKLTALPIRGVKNVYQRCGFSVAAHADLSQVVDFLFQFHSPDRLHRVDAMTLKPVRNSKKLAVVLSISALSVSSAARTDQLASHPSPAWKDKTIEEFREPILNRNFFSPPNAPPRLELASSTRTYLGKSLDLTAKGTDADALDRVTFAITKNVEPPASIDPASGRVSWSPRTKGDYTLEVAATDDGWPRGETKRTVVISVTDPPPPPPPMVVETAPPKPSFDLAKVTFLTAVLSVNEEPEAWLHIRTQGKTVKVHQGEEFEIGSVKGRVQEIGVEHIVFEQAGKLRRMAKGDSLADGKIIDAVSKSDAAF